MLPSCEFRFFILLYILLCNFFYTQEANIQNLCDGVTSGDNSCQSVEPQICANFNDDRLNFTWMYDTCSCSSDSIDSVILIMEFNTTSDNRKMKCVSYNQSTAAMTCNVQSSIIICMMEFKVVNSTCSSPTSTSRNQICIEPNQGPRLLYYTFRAAVLFCAQMLSAYSNEVNITITGETGIHCSTSERDIIDGDYKNSITIVTTTSESPVNPSFNIASPTDGSTGDSRTVTNTHDVDPTPSPKNTMDNKRAAGNTSPQFDLVGGLIAAGTILIISVLLVLTLVILIVVRKRKQKKKKVEVVDSIQTFEQVDTISTTGVDHAYVLSRCHSDQTELTEVLDSHSGLAQDKNPHSTDEGISDNSIALCTVKNVLYEEATEPKVTEYDREVRAVEGQQVTLRVSFTGIPHPKLSWTFNGSMVEGDYAIELGMDGSLLFVCVERKHAGRYHFVVSNTLGSVEGDVNLIVQNEDESREDVSQINSLDSHPVSEDEFGEYVATSHSNNNNIFILQYQSLASGEEGKLVDVGKSELNRPLNRFRNITAYDDQRIILGATVAGSSSSDSQTATDYINASYINGYSQEKQYIASQGPLPNTIADFWQMVWQEKVKIIAMVTNTMEGWSKKCEQYWPDCGRGQSHGPFNISLVEEVVFADYTVRKIQLTHTDKGENSCKVTQYHFTSWPDHGVPEYAGPILSYLRRIKAQHKPNKGPILVHCSAGVGRTGTLIAIDTALAQASKERQVDIPKIIVDMRKQRMKMVQTADQYAFIHDAVLESLMCGDTQIQSCNLRRGLGKLEETDKHNNMTGFEKHFKVLEQVSPKPSEVYSESATKYQEKNRNKSFLPPEKWRVTLKEETPDYIHASFANGYKQKKGFIIAQSPMDSTARDFVKMLYERECGVVVMLCGCEEGGVEVCAQYWPTSVGTTMKYGELLVSNTSTTNSDGVTKRIINISEPKSDRVQKVTQFQVDQWSEEGTCSKPQALMDVIDQMGVVQRRTGNKSIVVHGIDTVSRVGVFCSVVNAIEMCKTEGVVDVFQVVKALRIQKPGAVQTVNQYQSIFNLVVLFLDSFSVYSNFK